jgi:hypothetical protein
MTNEPRNKTVPVWEGAEYSRVAEGRYSAVASRIQGPDWVRRYGRWSLMVEFELLGEPESVRVCIFFNMGTNRAQPKAGRHSRYFRAWTLANGGLPRRGQAMGPEVFLEGQVYEIEVGDSRRDSEERQKTDAEVYSRVTAIVSAAHPNRLSPNQESVNQESRITQSPNQAVKQSSRPGGAIQPSKVIKFA